MTHLKFAGFCAGLILLLSSLSAFADHYIPKDGDTIHVRIYCTSVNETKANILSGHPNPIPDDIDCWVADFPLMGIFVGGVEGTVRDPNTNDVFDIHNVYPVYMINEIGFLEEFSHPVYIAVKRHGSDA